MYFIPTAMRNGLNKTKEYAHVRLYGYELVFLFSSIFYMFFEVIHILLYLFSSLSYAYLLIASL